MSNKNYQIEHLTKFKDIENDNNSNRPKSILAKIKSLNRASSSDTLTSNSKNFSK
jgi:hypothetical protein